MTRLRHGSGLPGSDSQQSNLGAMMSTILYDPAPLIGRERELEAILAVLLGECLRLLTDSSFVNAAELVVDGGMTQV